MTLPTNLPDALAMIGALLSGPRLGYGLAFVAVVLVGSGLLTAILLSMWTRR